MTQLEKAGDDAANKAINMRVHPQMSADTYAMVQADTLSEARAYAAARNIVIAEYKKMTETPKDGVEQAGEPQTTAKEKIYG